MLIKRQLLYKGRELITPMTANSNMRKVVVPVIEEFNTVTRRSKIIRPLPQGTLSIGLPALAPGKTESKDMRPAKHARGFSERYLSNTIRRLP